MAYRTELGWIMGGDERPHHHRSAHRDERRIGAVEVVELEGPGTGVEESKMMMEDGTAAGGGAGASSSAGGSSSDSEDQREKQAKLGKSVSAVRYT